MKSAFTFIDLFAGIGGFRLGMESLAGCCVFGSEIDKHAVATYERNFGDRPVGDIRKVDEHAVPDHDILCAGFPCQPFSISGKQLGFEDARGTLFFEVMRIVSAKRPAAVFLENVANYATHRNGVTLSRTLAMLIEAGYEVDWAVLNASNFGVPQARRRLYIVATRDDATSTLFRFPKPLSIPVALKDFLNAELEPDFPMIERDDIKIHETDVATKVARRPNRPIQIGKINKGGQGERIYSIEGHAVTLSAYGGGAAAKTGAYLVDGRVRRLHPEECRRIMGFPDSYQVDPRRNQAYKQFGNSVVAPVIEAIGRQVLRSIGRSEAASETQALDFGHELNGEPRC